MLGSVFCDYSMLVTMHKIDDAHFRLFGTNCFREETENTRFTAGSSPCCQKVKYRELKRPRRRRQQGHHKFAYLTMKNSIFVRFARAFFMFGHFEDALVLSTT